MKIAMGSIIICKISEDLFDALEYVIQEYGGTPPTLPHSFSNDNAFWEEGEGKQAIDECVEILEEMAPEYCYFGNPVGDYNNYGFWVDHGSIRHHVYDGTLKQVDDPGEVPDQGHAVIYNDHGNMSLYVDGKLIWDIV